MPPDSCGHWPCGAKPRRFWEEEETCTDDLWSRKENEGWQENDDGMVAAPWNLNIDIKDCCLEKVQYFLSNMAVGVSISNFRGLKQYRNSGLHGSRRYVGFRCLMTYYCIPYTVYEIHQGTGWYTWWTKSFKPLEMMIMMLLIMINFVYALL